MVGNKKKKSIIQCRSTASPCKRLSVQLARRLRYPTIFLFSFSRSSRFVSGLLISNTWKMESKTMRQICLRVWEPSRGQGRQEPQWAWLLQSWTIHPLPLNLSPEQMGYIWQKRANVLKRQILEHPTLHLLVTIDSLHVDMFLGGGAGKRHQVSHQLEREGFNFKSNKETKIW